MLRYLFVLKRTIILCLLTLAFTKVSAQYDVPFSHYWDLETYYNPAAVGKQPKLNVAAVYALDFAGFEHNPRSMFITGDMPFYALNSYHGVGVNLLNDQIGLFTHQRTAVQYAFKKNLFNGVLSVGVQAGLLMRILKALRWRLSMMTLSSRRLILRVIPLTWHSDSIIPIRIGMWDCRGSISQHPW